MGVSSSQLVTPLWLGFKGNPSFCGPFWERGTKIQTHHLVAHSRKGGEKKTKTNTHSGVAKLSRPGGSC